ncbi:DUF4330 domain-containing protein [bacterium]|nr:DUF4330 domain-containing protein [bacterium]
MFKKLKIVDIIVLIGITIMIAVGFLTYKHVRQTASGQIETTAKVGFHVFLRGVTLTGGEIPLKAGEKTFITIRNVPYSNVDILDVKAQARKTIVPSFKSKDQFILVDDIGQANMYDIVVVLTDTAKITKDGAVIGGNKVKIGVPITLEGMSYKLSGTVSDIRILLDNKNEEQQQESNVG